MRISNAIGIPSSALRLSPARPGSLTRIVIAVQRWRERARERQHLLRMTPRELQDIGLSNVDAWREANKPLWRD
jgi:uncharacterized protein YjiS (DUF1127 family)